MSGSANWQMVTPETVCEWIEAGEAVVYDVREANEFAAGHIAGAMLLPLSTLDPHAIQPIEGKRIVVHCRTARRCGIAAEAMAAAGNDTAIHRMAGGIVAWAELGLPIEK